MDMLLARAKELSSVLSKAHPPSQRPKHIVQSAPPARNQTHAVRLKRPEETEMEALLARAKELTAVLAKIHPPSQRANRTNRTASNQTTQRNATFDVNATFDLSHLVSTKPEQAGMDTLLARARELSAANRTARRGGATHGWSSLSGDDHSAQNHSGQEHSNASWGNHTETNKLLARVKELSAVLTQASPGEAVQRKLAGEAKHGLAAEAKHGLGEHEETDMAALLRRANELTAVLDKSKAVGSKDSFLARLSRAKKLSAAVRNHSLPTQPTKQTDAGVRDLLARAKDLSSVLSNADSPGSKRNLSAAMAALARKRAVTSLASSERNQTVRAPSNASTSSYSEQRGNTEQVRLEDTESLLARAKRLSAELATSSNLTVRPTQRSHAQLAANDTSDVPENFTNAKGEALIARAKQLSEVLENNSGTPAHWTPAARRGRMRMRSAPSTPGSSPQSSRRPRGKRGR